MNTLNKNYIHIDTLGLQHFCIKNNNPVEALKTECSISNLSALQTVKEIDWGFIYKGDDMCKNFILLTDLNEWSYLLWSYWDFGTNLELATKLSAALNTIVNYYFVDSHIATSRWIFTENGSVTRAYSESHGQIVADTGFNETESELRKTIRENFVEDIFWELYNKTCTTLEYFNSQKRAELKLYTGTIETCKTAINT